MIEVISFWQEAAVGSEIVVEGNALHAVDGDPSVRSKREFTRSFHPISEVADVCVFFYPRADLIEVLVPPHALVMPGV